ncbi:hypothetical protein DTL21_21095 [Bremerella cremea]|uniref:ECF transporter S component n=1 Tax=Blastopirellula marina TaxID=124 RepID=A0A2S8FKJ1_9BACT|nr:MULTISPECIES: DUF6580 family putative transport protein [Pirellulaceae]PQO32692.1 hypothetical protein C5Y83_21075 [Blastopirellula marina]RCS45759.1 hypothetical protein DTL21_21095 [Bremerella cremea]
MADAPQSTTDRIHSPRIWALVGSCLAFAIAVKLLPYLMTATGMQAEWFSQSFFWSFTPYLAVCLFVGAMLGNRWAACGVVLGSLLLSDLAIWGITGQFSWAFYPTLPVMYCCVLAIVVLGYTMRSGSTWAGGITMGIFASVGYFVVTNFFSWIALPEYTKDVNGLIQCYVMAIPFFRNMLMGTIFYSAILFSPAILSLATPATKSDEIVSRPGQAPSR